MSRRAHVIRAGVLAAAVAASACRTFEVSTPPGFLELHDPAPPFAYRAITPEGVVVAVRVVYLDNESGGLPFWARAITVRMREIDGYALLGESDVKARDGTPGHELKFGHDQSGKPYRYTVRVYIVGKRLFVIETGGSGPEVERYQPSIEWMQQTVKVW